MKGGYLSMTNATLTVDRMLAEVVRALEFEMDLRGVVRAGLLEAGWRARQPLFFGTRCLTRGKTSLARSSIELRQTSGLST